jgi:hypothetical protein
MFQDLYDRLHANMFLLNKLVYFAGGFYQDEMGYMGERSYGLGCKQCPPGSYVKPERTPGKSQTDCQSCPQGTHKQIYNTKYLLLNYLNSLQKLTFSNPLQGQISKHLLSSVHAAVWMTIIVLTDLDPASFVPKDTYVQMRPLTWELDFIGSGTLTTLSNIMKLLKKI